ncbi:MAG: hypothetical protein IKF82_00255 [Bacilli bacterium]|nr:hypothetical protein [Bacilli bacterium]
MSDIVLGCDTNGANDASCQNTVAEILEGAGHKVEKLGIGPNYFAAYSYDSSKAQGKIGVYLMADSLFSVADLAYGNTSFQYGYFGIRGDLGLPRMSTQEDFQNNPISNDADCTEICNKLTGKTYPQMNDMVKDRCQIVFGTTPEELGQAILAAMGGQTMSSAQTTEGATAVLIPDKTFYGLIKQILGAVDAVFIIANNMAYLLSFKDLYKYRDQFKDHIPELQATEIVSDSIIRHWTTSGLYNAVEVTYADGIIKYQYDALIEMYGESTFYYEFPEDDEETAKAKASALLSAHVRDYSLDLQLNCIYNPNITVGSWIKIPKKLTKLSGPISKQGAESDRQKPQKLVRKGLTIENIVEKIQESGDNLLKNIQTVTTEDGETYDIEIEKRDYEYYFVQGYKLKWTPEYSPIMSLHLKYGPDTPEDPVNATISTGGVSSGGVASGDAMYGDDCFGVATAQLENDHRIPHSGQGGVEYAQQNAPSPEMTTGRCKQGSAYEQEVRGKTGEEAFYIASSKFVYCLYADNCHLYTCNEQRWTSGECGFNCGDCSTILKSVLDCVGVKNWIFHIDGHYHNMVEISGKIDSADLSRSILGSEKSYTHTIGWPVAHTGSCSCKCHE